MDLGYEIDLIPIYSGVVSSISIDQKVNYTEDELVDVPILALKNVSFHGTLEKSHGEGIKIEGCIQGEMVLEDSISLEAVLFPFSVDVSTDLEESVKKDENTLDLKEFLWENIVLEIPLKFTKVEDLSKFRGDGWKLIGEDDSLEQENPFHELLKEFGEE